MATQDDDWFVCPVCGEVVQAEALACPACGADDETGWSEQAAYDEVELPGQASDEIDGPSRRATAAHKRWQKVTAMLLILVILLMILMNIW